ncbi:MAG: hypothetical protein ACLR30_05175 [[Clostridium] leptum]
MKKPAARGAHRRPDIDKKCRPDAGTKAKNRKTAARGAHRRLGSIEKDAALKRGHKSKMKNLRRVNCSPRAKVLIKIPLKNAGTKVKIEKPRGARIAHRGAKENIDKNTHLKRGQK